MPVPIICAGKYTNVTVAPLSEPLYPGNTSAYVVGPARDTVTLENDYMAFSDCEVKTHMDTTPVHNSWSVSEGTQGGMISGTLSLRGWIPAQKSMGLYIGRRVLVTHSWDWTDPNTSTAYTKPYSITVKIVDINIHSQVKGAINLSVECKWDNRMDGPKSQPGNFDSDKDGYGYRPLYPVITAALPYKV